MAVEPDGRHVEEDGAFVVGCVEGGEDVCGGWGVEARGVDVVDLDCVVCAVFEEGGVPGHCEVSISIRFLQDVQAEKCTLIADVWVYFLSIVRLAERIGDDCETFWIRCVWFMAHVRIVRAVERT